MKKRTLPLTLLLIILSSLASATSLTIGLGGEITWMDIAAAHPGGTYQVLGADGQPMGNIGLDGGDSTTYTIAVNDGMVSGTFDLTITALPRADPIDRAIAVHSGGSLIIDETDNFGGGDNSNINAVEVLQFSITDRSLTSLNGGLPRIDIVSFVTEGLNPTEFLNILKNSSTIIGDIQGDAANANAVNNPVSIPLDQSILRDNDELSFTHSDGSFYRLRSITLKITSELSDPMLTFFGMESAREIPDWIHRGRFSWLWVRDFPWIYSIAKKSWLYAIGNIFKTGAWFYDFTEGGFWWTNDGALPWIYRTNGNWVYGEWTEEPAVEIQGELKQWHKVTLTFDGPFSSETASTNPFLDYRLDVTFENGSTSYVVPGYYAADGNAAQSTAESGNKWRVHFAPDQTGTWTYKVSFREGANVALNDDIRAGTSAGYFDRTSGSFEILPTDKVGRDLRAKGRLEYVGEHYLRFAGTGEYFFKQGADSPENLLAYEEFDGDFKSDGIKDNFIKSWASHVIDWEEGDPVWQGDKGKGIIGAVNYLASAGMNSISFLTLNIEGDDSNVYPYTHYSERFRMDVSKLDQWEMLFQHAQEKGLYLHFKTQETENELLLDGGELGPQRKLYYRELLARFGHHLALNWNLGEESFDQTHDQRKAMAQYFHDHDPYSHHVVIHTYPAPDKRDPVFTALLGENSKLTGASLQVSGDTFSNVYNVVKQWRENSANADRKWVIACDEPGGAIHGLVPDNVDPFHELARQNGLWATFLAGGAGNEWYFGYNHPHSDLTCEDFRSRDLWWNQCRIALEFLDTFPMPVTRMIPLNTGVNNAVISNGLCLASLGEHYLIYLPNGGTADLDLSSFGGSTFFIHWFDPQQGGNLKPGTALEIEGGTRKNIGLPPYGETGKDWVAIVTADPSYGLIMKNEPPQVSQLSPVGEFNVQQGEILPISVAATDSDGNITRVEFFINGVLQASQSTPNDAGNYLWEAEMAEIGRQVLYAKAYDERGGYTVSRPAAVEVFPSIPAFVEEAGILVIEMENVNLPQPSDWTEETSLSGFTGQSYLQYLGVNNFPVPPDEKLYYRIKINLPGTYEFAWRSRNGESAAKADEQNDSWLRIQGDRFYGTKGLSETEFGSDFIKVWIQSMNSWSWASNGEHGNNNGLKVFARFDEPGYYYITLAGRSKGHPIDRMALWHSSVTEATATDLARPESSQE